MIYFIKTSDDKFVKIGFTNNLKNRLGELQTASPVKLSIIAWCEGDRKYEQILHKIFKAHKTETNNEWFNYCDEIKSFITTKTNDITSQPVREILERELVLCENDCLTSLEVRQIVDKFQKGVHPRAIAKVMASLGYIKKKITSGPNRDMNGYYHKDNLS